YGVDAAARSDPNDLVLQREQKTDLDRGLRGGVVRVAGLAEPAGGRPDEDEASPAGALDDAEEVLRREKRRREVRAQRRVPPVEPELPHRLVLARPHAGVRDADVQVTGGSEEPLDLRLVGQVGAERSRVAELRRDRLRATAIRVVVHDDVRALRCKRTRAR